MEPPIMEISGPELLAALRLQIAWGADEALEDAPVDRLRLQARATDRPSAPQAGVSAIVKPRVVPPATALTSAAAAAMQAEQAAGAANDLTALRAAVGAFDGCALRDTATHLVFAEGDAQAGLLLIGDAPGADDDRSGQPFAGAAGDWLDKMLASVGASRAQALLSPLIPWRPPGDRLPTAAELAVCLPFLRRLIVLARPRHIVLFSSLAARTLLPAEPRRRPRGGWVALPVPGLDAPVPTLASVSLSAVMQTPARRREAWADLRRLSRALHPPKVSGS